MATNLSIENSNITYAPFNSVINSTTGTGDRRLNADHFARWLSSVNSDGVARKFDELEIDVVSGMNVIVKSGIGFVDGRSMYLASPLTIALEAGSANGDRVDTIGYRLERANRKVVMYYKTGTVGSNEAPEIVDDGDIKEIPLYNIEVASAAVSISKDNLIDLRTYVVSSATYFKPYTQLLSTTSSVSSVIITKPFNAETDVVSVLINGRELLETQYSISGNIITFKQAISSGNEIQITIWHFMEGRGTIDSLNKVADLQSAINNINQYFYICNGVNDNIKLSQLAQSFLGGTGQFSGVDANAQIEIVVCGKCGVSTKYSGTGTEADPFVYFAFGRTASVTRTIYFNFGNCNQINFACPTTTNTFNTIFGGLDINIRNCRMNVTAGYNVNVFFGQNIHCQDSEFWVTGTNNVCVGRCCGVFENVRTSIDSSAGNAYCFYCNGNLLRVIGGTHYAYTASSSKVAVCFYVIDAAANNENVLFITMTNCPQKSRSGYYQTDTIQVNRGYCTAIMNTLWKAATFGSSTETTIAYGNVIISKI